MGIKDIVAKSTGSSNPHNMIKATLEALNISESPKSAASKRSKNIKDIISSKKKVNMKMNQLKSNHLHQIKKEKELGEVQVLVLANCWKRIQMDKNQDQAFLLMDLKEDKCLFIEDCLKEVLKIFFQKRFNQ